MRMNQGQTERLVKMTTSDQCFRLVLCVQGCVSVSHHDDFHPLSHRVGLVVLFLCQHVGKLAELPDWAALATLS